ncbi:telomere length regulation protein TEL2 homolog [Dermacentor albipictus]|uniref:telomere length regulation protein TEL2 homolog n=1 Tax=Dermacentor albipictus TaxID=60249 RepID=UPI0031FD4C60
MSENASSTSEAIELTCKLLSHITINDKREAIQRILGLPPEASLSSADASLYCHFVTSLLDNLSANTLRNAEEDSAYDAVVMRCPPEDLLLVLASALQRYNKSFRRDKVVALLSKFVQGNYLHRLLIGQCRRNVTDYSGEWSCSALTILVSLPVRIANIRDQDIPNCLTTNAYFESLFDSILGALSYARDEVDRGADVHVTFFSRLLGRVCLVGQSELLAKHLVPKLVRRCEGDFIFRRVCVKVVTSALDDCMESMIVVLLSALRDYNHVDWFLADSVCTNSRLKFFLTMKLPLMKTFSKAIVLQNVIGYLASSERRRPIFFDFVNEVLSVWGDKTFMKHQSEEQQKYLTSALMISLGHLKVTSFDKTTADGLMSKLLHGVQSHISSPDEWVRLYGMITAEQFSAILQPEGPKLNFEYNCNDDVNYLLSLTDITVKPSDPVEESMEEAVSIEEETEKANVANNDNMTIELDSDDDLEPFDMSHDTPHGVKKPVYLRDCMEGLLDQENRDWVESCLQTVASLIQTCKDELPDVAEELAKILLYLDDKFGLDRFVPLRQHAQVTLAVNSPKVVATYLTEQFYGAHLNIRQRLDILEVLALASNQLASPPTAVPPVAEKSISSMADTHWQSVVMERVKAKTRIISKGATTIMKPAENRFSDVAGFFFYPLMSYYDRKENTFDLLGEDSFVLARLICTLGIVQDSAANCPRSAHMAHCLMEFVSALKYHTEACVRDAVLFALSVIFITIPTSLLLSSGEHELVEIREWLQYVIEKDPFDVCKLKAAQVLQLLMSQVNKELPVSDK